MAIKQEFGKIEFLCNRLTEPMKENLTPLPSDVQRWYETLDLFDEDGYLVKWEGEYGYLVSHEYIHDSVGIEENKAHAQKENCTSDRVIEYLGELALELNRSLQMYYASDFDIIIGRYTGFDKRHELCIFLPVDHTSNIDLLRARIHLQRLDDQLSRTFWKAPPAALENEPIDTCKMKAICPNDPEHTTFVASAIVAEEWVVDASGNKIQSNGVFEDIHAPVPNDEAQWRCNVCNAPADFVK